MSLPLPEAPRKRKHDQIADSRIDDDDARSDYEFGWDADEEQPLQADGFTR